MRKTLLAALALAALVFPAPAAADLLDTYQRLSARRLSPAPLVPTRVPPSLAPLERTVTGGSTRRASGYALRIVQHGPDAVIALEGGAFKTIAAALRDSRRLGFTKRPTRVRGHRGYLLTRHVGPTQWSLLWSEGGRVYSIGTGTPKRVSLQQLRATAAGLDRLERDYIGSGGDPDNPSEGFAVTTEHTVTANVGWGAQCLAPDGSVGTPRAGTMNVALLPRRGNAFAFDIGVDGWAGSVSGTIAPSAITLNLRATGTFDGSPCDTGPVQMTLPRGT
jgi:hypothetical protein